MAREPIIGHILDFTMITPVSQPMKVHRTIAMRNVGAQAIPAFVRSTADTTVTTEIMEPIARFRPPEIMQIIMPRDMIPVIAL